MTAWVRGCDARGGGGRRGRSANPQRGAIAPSGAIRVERGVARPSLPPPPPAYHIVNHGAAVRCLSTPTPHVPSPHRASESAETTRPPRESRRGRDSAS